MKNQYYQFMLDVCNYRNNLVKHNRSKKNHAKMITLIEKHLDRWLNVYPNASEEACARYFKKYHQDFICLMPGESSTSFKKYDDRFQVLIYGADKVIESEEANKIIKLQKMYNQFNAEIKEIVGNDIKVSVTLFNTPKALMDNKNVHSLIGNGNYIGSDNLTLFNKK